MKREKAQRRKKKTKLGSESKTGSEIFHTPDTHTHTNGLCIPLSSCRQEKERERRGWGVGGGQGGSEGVGTRCTEWVWRSGWADTRRVAHQTPRRARAVQRRHVGAE